MPQRPTMKLCSARRDDTPTSARCVLPANHDPKTPHEGIGQDGKVVQWTTAPK